MLHTRLVMEQVSNAIADGTKRDVFLNGIRDISQFQAESTLTAWKTAMQRFMQDVNAGIPLGQRSAKETMTEDSLAKLCMVLISLRDVFEALDSLLFSTVL